MKRAYKEDKMFKAFKKKLQHESMIKSIIYGIIGRFFSSAILIAMCKFLNRIYLLKYLTAPVAILSLLLVTIGNYILTKPSDKSIAKRLDNDLHLQEKMSTMIEFNDMDGIIIDKQHEDAIDALNKQTPKNIKLKLNSFTLPIFIISMGLFTGSFFMPSLSNNIVDPIIPANPSDNIDSILKEFVSEGKSSIDNIDPGDDVNDKLDKILDTVIQDLEETTDPDDRENIINNAKNDVDKVIDDANSKDEIGDELIKSDDDALKKLGQAIKDGDVDKISEALGELKDEFERLNGQELVDKLHSIADTIRNALENSQIPEGDPLRDALKKLADELDKEADELQKSINSGNDTSEETKENLKKDLDDAEKEIKDAIDQQNKNEQAGQTAKDTLDKMKDAVENNRENNNDDTSGEKGSENTSGNGEPNSGNKPGSENNSGKGEPGNGDKPGSEKPATGNGNNNENSINNEKGGPGSGDGKLDHAGNDHVYTEEGDTEYGTVIDGRHNDALTDASNNADGDSSINNAVDDYFKELYGDGSKSNP